MQNTTGITVSFACTNSAMAAKMIQYFDRLSSESMQQLSDNLRDHPEQWTEFRPDGSTQPVSEPMNFTPPHVSQPNSSAVSPTAADSAPNPYQQQPAPSAPPQPQTPPAPPAPPAPQQQAQQPAPQAVQQPAQQANYQQTSMTYAST